MTHTYTFAVMPVSKRTYDEIAAKMREAGYDHAFTKSQAHGDVIDMNGIAIAIEEEPVDEKDPAFGI